MRRLLLVLGLSLLAAAPALAGWRARYPVFGGSVPMLRVDAGGTLYAAVSGGLFKSSNGGTSWSSALGNLPTTSVTVIAPDPVQVGTIYVATDMGLFRTADGGTSWTRLPLNLPAGTATQAMAIAPTDTNRIFVATWGSYVWRSLDHGATWSQSSAGLSGGWSGPSFTTSMAVDPTNANRVYTSTWRGRLFRSDDAAATWTAIADGGTWANSNMYVARSNPAVLYTLNDEYWFGRGTVLRSADYGNSWTACARPAARPGDAIQLAIDPTNENIVYVTTGGSGVLRSTNGGASWTLVLSLPGSAAMNAIAIEPGTPSHVYAGSYTSGVYASLDSGATWAPRSSGLAAATIPGLGLCRDTPTTIYAGAQGVGFVKSADGGTTWSPIGTAQGMQNLWIGALTVHPTDPNIAVVTTSDNNSTSYVWRTVDGGASFTATATGYFPTSLAFNPLAPSYVHGSVSDWQGGYIRSGDGGANWSVPYWWYIYPTLFAFHPTLSNVALSPAFQYTGAALNTLHVTWSNNNGASWTSMVFGQGDVSGVVLDGNDPTTLYVAGTLPGEGTRGVYKFRVTYSGGNIAAVARIAGTFNGGLPNPAVRRLAYDKANGLLYASTPNGLFRSADQALSWTSVNDGLPYLSSDLMAITPDGRSVYVATSGGVWEYSDALPVPVATPVLTTTPAALLQQVVSGTTTSIAVSATSTTLADTITLSAATSAPTFTFTSTSGNPAGGTMSITPGANLRGKTYAVTLTAQSTLDPSKSATITRYLSVVGDTSTDASALISNSSGGSINAPNGQFSLDLAAGAIASTGVSTVSAVNVANKPDACLQVAGGKKMCAKPIAAYDITVDNALHYTFNSPVALTFAFGPGVVTNLADLQVVVFNEATGLYEVRSDTACLAAFGRVPFTGSAAAGGTISVCTSTVSSWALIDSSKLVPANRPPVANAGPDQTIELTTPTALVQLDGSASSDPDGDALTYSWSGPFGTASGATPVVTLGWGTQTITLTVDDGNGATATDTVVIDLRDSDPPAITITVPSDGAAFLLNQPGVAADFGCTDAVSGVATCTGGPAIDTAIVGEKTFTVNATDLAGNSASLTSAYSVVYAFGGFLPPVAVPPAVNSARGGSTIPLKWQLRDAAGAFITDVKTLRALASTPIDCDATPAPFTGGDAILGGGKGVRYDPTDNQFVFNWQTSTAWRGCRALQLTLDDGSRRLAVFSFK